MGIIKHKGNTYGGLGSGGVVDTSIIEGSTNAVSGGAVFEALQNAGVSPVEITMTEYEALSDEEKNNGVPYYITDSVGSGITLATELNSFATDEQIPSAKAVVDAMDDYLPLTGGTLSGTVTVSKNLASFAAKHNDGAAVYYGTHNNRARIKTQNVAGSDANYRFLDLNNSDRGNVEILQLGDCTDGTVSWYNVLHTGNLSQNGICTTAVADVPLTTVAINTTDANLLTDDTSAVKYMVRNGVCYVDVANIGIIANATQTCGVVFATLPKPVLYYRGAVLRKSGSSAYLGGIYVDGTGEASLWLESTAKGIGGVSSFSYPVAQ